MFNTNEEYREISNHIRILLDEFQYAQKLGKFESYLVITTCQGASSKLPNTRRIEMLGTSE